MSKKYIPTKEQRDHVRVMAAVGMPHELICRQLINPETKKIITQKTLVKAFKKELDEGLATANAMVARSLYQKAISDGRQSVAAAIFWLKTRAGWKESIDVNSTIKDYRQIPADMDAAQAAQLYLANLN